MRLVSRGKLAEFCALHPTARKWIECWIMEVEGAAWRTPQDVKDRYSSASFLGENIVIFNVKGNDFRMEVQIAFGTQVVAVRWIGTHATYDERNKKR